METKQVYLKMLQDEKARWEKYLTGLTEAQIGAPKLDDGWSIKDVVAHLMAWQQVTNARLRAALRDEEPDFGNWPEGLDPESEDDLDAINAWIFAAHHERSWGSIYQDWRSGFQRVLDTARSVPNSVLMELGRFAWLPDTPLIAVLQGTYEHHDEHWDWLMEALAG